MQFVDEIQLKADHHSHHSEIIIGDRGMAEDQVLGELQLVSGAAQEGV